MPAYANSKGGTSTNTPVTRDPREVATRVEQVVNAVGSVTSVTYILANGDTVTDTLTYGSNSTSEPTVVIFGSLVTGTLVLSNFTIAANGTSVTYTATGGTVTNLVGQMTINGTVVNLTHVSSGNATIPKAYSGQVATVTLSNATTPRLSSTGILTNAPTTNNSVQTVPTLVLSNFVLGSGGTTISYTSTGGTVTALAGSLSVDGTLVPIASFTSTTITVASQIRQGAVVTINIASTTPALLAGTLAGVSVTNNSTYVPTVGLSSFTIGSNGTSVSYTATGGTIGTLSGNLVVGGTSYPLTHISSGSASIATTVLQGQVATITINSSTPTVSPVVVNAAVTNNSTQVPQQTLSSFAIASNGTSVSYSVVGQPITALTGSITVGGTSYPLTHVSSGNATIPTAVNQGVTATVSVTASTPTLSSAVTNAAVTNGSTVTPVVSLSSFAIAANGTSVTYSVTGATVTALTGSITAGSNTYPLTHISSGSASIATAVNQGDVCTVSITSSTPTVSPAVTNVAVTNGSTVVSAPTITPLALPTRSAGVTEVAVGTYRVDSGAGGQGGATSTKVFLGDKTIELSNVTANGYVCFGLEVASTTPPTAYTSFEYGILWNNANGYYVDVYNGGVALIQPFNATDKVRIYRVGSAIKAQVKVGAGNWTDFKTWTGSTADHYVNLLLTGVGSQATIGIM